MGGICSFCRLNLSHLQIPFFCLHISRGNVTKTSMLSSATKVGDLTVSSSVCYCNKLGRRLVRSLVRRQQLIGADIGNLGSKRTQRRNRGFDVWGIDLDPSWLKVMLCVSHFPVAHFFVKTWVTFDYWTWNPSAYGCPPPPHLFYFL